MRADELQELHEHAEHAHHNPSLAPVSLTMAVLAVLVAVASLLGHRAHTEEVILEWHHAGIVYLPDTLFRKVMAR